MNSWSIVCSESKVYQTLVLIDSIRQYGDLSEVNILAIGKDTKRALDLCSTDVPSVYVYSENEVLCSDIKHIRQDREYYAYCWTLKSIFLDFLILKKAENDTLTFIDADLYFYSNMSLYLSNKDYSIFFTQEERYNPVLSKEEMDRIRDFAGIFNSGFISFRNDQNGRECIRWWKECCVENCGVDKSTFGDQKYLNQMPLLFNNVLFEETLNLNIGPWNNLKREFSLELGNVYFGEQPLLFYHFSGYRINKKDNIAWSSNAPKGKKSFTDYNPSIIFIYENYTRLIKNKIDSVFAIAPDFYGFSDQAESDLERERITEDILKLTHNK